MQASRATGWAIVPLAVSDSLSFPGFGVASAGFSVAYIVRLLLS